MYLLNYSVFNGVEEGTFVVYNSLLNVIWRYKQNVQTQRPNVEAKYSPCSTGCCKPNCNHSKSPTNFQKEQMFNVLSSLTRFGQGILSSPVIKVGQCTTLSEFSGTRLYMAPVPCKVSFWWRQDHIRRIKGDWLFFCIFYGNSICFWSLLFCWLSRHIRKDVKFLK